MYYIIERRFDSEKIETIYTLYNVYTMSLYDMEEGKLTRLMRHNKLQVKNAYIKYDSLHIKDWVNKL